MTSLYGVVIAISIGDQRGHFYPLYKTDFGFEKYLINLKKRRRIRIGYSIPGHNI